MPIASLFAAALLSPALSADIQLGADEAANAAAFANQCDSTDRRVLDPADMPVAEDSYVQVDCMGYAYLGAPRKAEFVFADGRLSHVWVLVEDSELPALQTEFEQAYGAADVDTPGFAAFYQARGAVRRDIPEALFYAEHVAPMFEAWFSGPQ